MSSTLLNSDIDSTGALYKPLNSDSNENNSANTFVSASNSVNSNSVHSFSLDRMQSTSSMNSLSSGVGAGAAGEKMKEKRKIRPRAREPERGRDGGRGRDRGGRRSCRDEDDDDEEDDEMKARAGRGGRGGERGGDRRNERRSDRSGRERDVRRSGGGDESGRNSRNGKNAVSHPLHGYSDDDEEEVVAVKNNTESVQRSRKVAVSDDLSSLAVPQISLEDLDDDSDDHHGDAPVRVSSSSSGVPSKHQENNPFLKDYDAEDGEMDMQTDMQTSIGGEDASRSLSYSGDNLVNGVNGNGGHGDGLMGFSSNGNDVINTENGGNDVQNAESGELDSLFPAMLSGSSFSEELGGEKKGENGATEMPAETEQDAGKDKSNDPEQKPVESSNGDKNKKKKKRSRRDEEDKDAKDKDSKDTKESKEKDKKKKKKRAISSSDDSDSSSSSSEKNKKKKKKLKKIKKESQSQFAGHFNAPGANSSNFSTNNGHNGHNHSSSHGGNNPHAHPMYPQGGPYGGSIAAAHAAAKGVGAHASIHNPYGGGGALGFGAQLMKAQGKDGKVKGDE